MRMLTLLWTGRRTSHMFKDLASPTNLDASVAVVQVVLYHLLEHLVHTLSYSQPLH
jgi:hypothetical protein